MDGMETAFLRIMADGMRRLVSLFSRHEIDIVIESTLDLIIGWCHAHARVLAIGAKLDASGRGKRG